MMTDYTDRAARLRVLWNRGRQIYTSFFSELGQTRAEIGDEQIGDWCFYELQISLSNCNRIAGILKDADARREKDDLAIAHEQERKQKRERRALEKQRREAERAAEQQRREAENAERKRQSRNKRERNRCAAARKQDRSLEKPRPADVEMAQWIDESERIDQLSRVERGRLYQQMKEKVDTQQVGKNPKTAKPWTWMARAQAYIPRSRMDVYRCVTEFNTKRSENETSCYILQSHTVDHSTPVLRVV
jgi:hypothetical protein